MQVTMRLAELRTPVLQKLIKFRGVLFRDELVEPGGYETEDVVEGGRCRIGWCDVAIVEGECRKWVRLKECKRRAERRGQEKGRCPG